MSTTVMYGIRHCDTVKKARAFLESHGVEHRFHDFKKDGVPRAELEKWVDAVGVERLVNRQGTTWRKLDDARRAAMTDAASAIDLMCAEPSVIKRPVMAWPDGETTVGFDNDGFRLAASRA